MYGQFKGTGESIDHPVPAIAVVFGAAGHLGAPAAHYFAKHAPTTVVRVVTSDPNKLDRLASLHPRAEPHVADYLDTESLRRAVDGAEAVIVVTPDFLDEQEAMTNLVGALTEAGSVHRVVRVTGDPIGIHDVGQVPAILRDLGRGTAVQHLTARRILDASGLPVAYVNVAAYYMDNLVRFFGRGLRTRRLLAVAPDHHMAWVDSTDVGEACAALVLSPDHRHAGKTYHMDNGHDVLLFAEVAGILSDELGEPIAFDGTPETLRTLYLERGISEAQIQYSLDYLAWETEMSTVWRRTDIVEYLLGRPATTLRQWIRDHRDMLLTPARARA